MQFPNLTRIYLLSLLLLVTVAGCTKRNDIQGQILLTKPIHPNEADANGDGIPDEVPKDYAGGNDEGTMWVPGMGGGLTQLLIHQPPI